MKYVAIALATLITATAAQAQFQTENAGASSASGAGGGAFAQQDSFSNVTTSFDGIDVNVMRLIKDPAGDDMVRLILQLTSTSNDERRLLFTSPATTLIDELGNVYVGVQSAGVEICGSSGRIWNQDSEGCRISNSNREKATRLAPGVPVMVSMIFKPTDDFSADLAQMSQTVSLRSRIAYYPDDFSETTTADIIVNNIPSPR
jgi:hypothetical protein